MTEQLTIRGLVATTPKNVVTESGLAVTSFRLAAPARRFSVADNAWVTDQTNWYTVSAFRQLAQNSASSISKGDRVLVHGRLKIRDWDNGERSGTAVELDA
ncbi:MAG: single-stranded DNA-binding protein, partial [Aquiluna sp.]